MATLPRGAASSEAASVFDLASDAGDELDWASIYYYVGLAASAANEAVDNLHLLRRVHLSVAGDTRIVSALVEARALQERLRQLAGAAYARSEEAGRAIQDGR